MKKKKTNRYIKRRFNSRFSWCERLLQRVPNWLLVLFSILIISIVSFWADDKLNLSKIPPSVTEIRKKSRLLMNLIISNAAPMAIVSGVLLYFKEAPDRKEAKHYEAFQVIDNAAKLEKSYARIKALQDLNNDDVSLTNLNLSHVNLEAISLKGASFYRAELEGADLFNSDLTGASFRSANLKNAKLTAANLTGANLEGANLRGAKLMRADLCNAIFYNADLAGANLENANLKGANFESANFESAQIKSACNWEQAIYISTLNKTNNTLEAKEPDNTDFIKSLRDDKLSNPRERPNCSKWND